MRKGGGPGQSTGGTLASQCWAKEKEPAKETVRQESRALLQHKGMATGLDITEKLSRISPWGGEEQCLFIQRQRGCR